MSDALHVHGGIRAQWFKIQTPLNRPEMVVLLYNESRDVMLQLDGPLADELITALDMSPIGDRLYVMAIIKRGKDFIVNKDTITRKDKGW